MNIAITPRVGINTRRDEDRLKAENDLLLEIADRPIDLPIRDRILERNRLRAAGMIESYRSRSWKAGRNAYWCLTDAGRARVAAIRAREGKS